MYSVTAASAQWDMVMGKSKDAAGIDGDAFSKIFDSFKTQSQNKGGFDGLLSFFGDRFPNAKVKEAEVGAGVKGTEEAFGDEEGDQVAFDGSALSGMLGDGALAKQIEEALAKFFDTANTQSAEGSYTQRRVSVTITTIRFSVAQRDSGTGELQSSEELKAQLGEKIKEMIDKFFGSGKTDKTEETKAADETEKSAAKDNPLVNFGSSWSMEYFYSQTMFSGANGNGQITSQSWQFSAFSASASASSFGQSVNSSFFEAMGMSGGQFGSGPFTSLLGGSLEQFGLSADSFKMEASGYSMRVRESRNLMAELMELYGSRIRPKDSEETYKQDETKEAETVEETEEAAAVE